MAVESTMIPLGTPMPELSLPDLQGRMVTLGYGLAKSPLLVAFLCNHCPYVRHVETVLGSVTRELMGAGLHVVGISSNDTSTHPQDDPTGMAEQSLRAGWTFPYLIDADQLAAKSFGAACTPDFFIFDYDGLLAYRGAMDESTPKNGQPVTGHILRTAALEVLAGQSVPEPHRPSMGCGIKWRGAAV